MKSILKQALVPQQIVYAHVICVIMFLSFGLLEGWSQNRQIVDSLQLELKEATTDLEKAQIYIKLVYNYVSSDSTKAVSYAFQALDLSKKSGYGKGIAEAWYYIGVVNWIRGHITEAEQWMLKAKKQADSLNLGRESARVSMGMGTINAIKGNYDSALTWYNKAKSTFTKLEYMDGLGAVYIELGISHRHLGDYEMSKESFLKALEINSELNAKRSLLATYGNLGVLHNLMGEEAKSLDYFFNALEISIEIGDKNSEVTSYGNIGELYNNKDEVELARKYLLKSLELVEEMGNPLQIAKLKVNIGKTYLDEGNAEEALRSFLEGLEKALEISNKPLEARAYQNASHAYTELVDYSSALDFSNKALAIYEEISEKYDHTNVLIDLGRIYIKLNQPITAKRYILKGFNTANESEFPNLLREAVEQLAYVEKVLGNDGAAYDAHVLFKEMYDSLQNEDVTKKLTRLQAEYEFQQEKDSIAFEQQKANIAYEEELERRQTFIQVSTGGGILVLIILILLYRSYLIKQKRNYELHKKNKVIEVKNEELLTKNGEINTLRQTEKKMSEETIALKERELTTVTMLSHEKNSLLQQLGDQIGQLSTKVSEDVIPDLKEIKRTIKTNLSGESWSMFMYQFEKVHPAFFIQLKEQHSILTQHDLRLCAYIKVGMDNKEIAQISNVTNAGIQKSINRLKKKMELDSKQDLREFLMNF